MSKIPLILTPVSEDQAIEDVLRASKEITLGFGLSGDLRELAKKFK